MSTKIHIFLLIANLRNPRNTNMKILWIVMNFTVLASIVDLLSTRFVSCWILKTKSALGLF